MVGHGGFIERFLFWRFVEFLVRRLQVEQAAKKDELMKSFLFRSGSITQPILPREPGGSSFQA